MDIVSLILIPFIWIGSLFSPIFGNVNNSGVSNLLIKLSGTTIVPVNSSWTFGGGGISSFPFTPTTNYGTNVNSTSTPVWFTNGIMASSTSRFVNASTTLTTANKVFTGNGTAALPGYSFTNDITTGFHIPSGAVLDIDIAGQAWWELRQGFLKNARQNVYCWTSTTSDGTATCDTGLSRFGAGVVAVGNAAAADVSGTLVAASVGVASSTPWGQLSIAGVSTSLYPFIISTTTGTVASTTLFAVDKAGDVHYGGGTPTLSSCGTGPTLGPNSTDQSGEITFGATAGGCTVTFSVAKASSPHCIVTTEAQSLVNAYTYTDSTTALVITQASSGGTTWDYFCPLGH